MQIKSTAREMDQIRVTITADREEINSARINAYRDNTERYPLPGVAPGEADLPGLMRSYGPAVLYDEALDRLIPKLFEEFLAQSGVQVIGRPRVDDIAYEPDGAVTFAVTADCFPEVILGDYRGIVAENDRSKDPDAFEREVLGKAVRNMQTHVPAHMLNQKIDAIEASEKMHIAQDAIYHLLADTLVYLKAGYAAAGVTRPAEQVREQAMDITLSMVSFDNKQIPENYLAEQIGDEVGRYRELPENFEDLLRAAMEKRKAEKAKMKPETRIEEVFKAYLGSVHMNEEEWRESQKEDARRQALEDLLFMKVAGEEKLRVSNAELHDGYQALADKYGVNLEDILKALGEDVLRAQLLRDKARTLILDSAVHA